MSTFITIVTIVAMAISGGPDTPTNESESTGTNTETSAGGYTPYSPVVD